MKQPSYLDSIPLTTSEASSAKSEPASPDKKPETGLEVGRTVLSMRASSSSSSESDFSGDFPPIQSLGAEVPDPSASPPSPPVQTPAKAPQPIRPLSPIAEAEVQVEEEDSWSAALLAVGAALLGGVLLLRLMQG